MGWSNGRWTDSGYKKAPHLVADQLPLEPRAPLLLLFLVLIARALLRQLAVRARLLLPFSPVSLLLLLLHLSKLLLPRLSQWDKRLGISRRRRRRVGPAEPVLPLCELARLDSWRPQRLGARRGQLQLQLPGGFRQRGAAGALAAVVGRGIWCDLAC